MNNEYIEEPEEPNKKVKERAISFRVDEETYRSIENMVEGTGKKPTEWARELVESEAAKDVPMTAGERLLFEEMARVRFIVGNALKLMAGGDLTLEAWFQVLAEADQNSDRIAEELLAKRRAFGSRSVQREEQGLRG